jgi:molybdopterin-binding protein
LPTVARDSGSRYASSAWAHGNTWLTRSLSRPSCRPEKHQNTNATLREAIMKVGARNRIMAKVEEIKKGSIMCLVKVSIPDPSHMASVMTLESLEELGIKKGDSVEVIVKAVNVLLVKS